MNKYIRIIGSLFLLAFTISGNAQDFRLNIGSFENMVLTNQKNINTKGLETFPGYIHDTLVLVAGVEGGKDFQIVMADEKTSEGWKNFTFLPKEVNSPFYEGPFSFDAKNEKLYFTRSNYNKKKINRENARQKDSVVIHLQIMEYDWMKGGKSQKININHEEYSVCDPALSPDGEWMVFASDQPGGKGGRDLYIARRDGLEWVGVQNLGLEVNSASNEGFPWFANNNVLLFASNRQGGLGGFDIYFAEVKNGIWYPAKLLPKPVNSPYDDLGFIIHANTTEGYLASNRPGGKGEDDIYKWTSPMPVWQTIIEEEEVDIDVFVFEKLTLLPFPEAKIMITPLDLAREDFTLDDPNIDIVNLDTSGNLYLKWNPLMDAAKPLELLSDDAGKASITLKYNQYYKVEGSCEICDTEILFFKPALHGKQLNLALQPGTPDDEESDDAPSKDIVDLDSKVSSGAVFVLENIYYGYDSDKIINDGENDLDILIQKMEENPDIRILLESHTDSRGEEAYNLLLSLKRANTAKNYLIDRGIEPERILTKGLGESRLRNGCKNGVPCKEEEHRYNRRTEVIILPED